MELRNFLPLRALWLLMIPFAASIITAITDLSYTADTVFAQLLFGWSKQGLEFNLFALSTWLLLMAPCWAFTANLALREGGPRLMLTLHRIGSRVRWYLQLSAASVVWTLTYCLVPVVTTAVIDGLQGLWPLYSMAMLRGWGQFFLFLMSLSLLAMVVQLATGKVRTGFTAAFVLFLLPEIPIGLLSPIFGKMPQHYPMLIRSVLFVEGGYHPNTALFTLAVLTVVLWAVGFLFLSNICDIKIGG